ncbi:glycosyltransferase family 2 protein [Streptomyces californicus]|uniref:glycosyltransferase family 2 protein n=1 Tax=Streptomyces californicus TaxID=67351 RepID=UPI0037F2851D
MTQPDLSVVIPSYQHAEMLDLTLGALARQSHSAFEVLVMDDDSTDGTAEVCARHAEVLDLHLHVSKAEMKSPSRARDEGARLARGSVIAFLDCGIVVPSGYVAAHLRFHRDRTGQVGVGMCHGHSPETEQGSEWADLLGVLSVDDSGSAITSRPGMADVRYELPDLTGLRMPWVWAWSGNISMPKDAYLVSGGFDTSRSYGYEDSDLAYRMHLRGNAFTFVEDGWGIHYPHPRKPAEELEAASFAGWWKTYTSYRSLALEIERFSKRNETPGESELRHLNCMERLHTYLGELGEACAKRGPLPERALPAADERSLLIGGSVGNAEAFTYTTLLSSRVESTGDLWPCAGVIVPLPDDSLDVVVVSEVWKWLSAPQGADRVDMFDMMIADLRRVATRAVFLDAPDGVSPAGTWSVSLAMLHQACSRAGLSYEVVR